MFFANGFGFSNWVARIPDVKATLGIDEAALGVALLGVGLGGLIGSGVAARLLARLGARITTMVAGVALGVTLPLPGFAPTVLALLVALTIAGIADALVDIAMNTHGVAVERRYGRPILSGFHAWWSIGAAAGAGTGALAAASRLPVAAHLALAGAGVAGLTLLAVKAFRSAACPVIGAAGAVRAAPTGRASGGSTRSLAVLCLLVFCAAIVEGAPADWGAVYLRETLGAAPGIAATGYAAFAVAMLVGRLVGDRAVQRWGGARVARAGGLLAAAGMAVVVAATGPLGVAAGFAAVGVGVCTVFPLVFGAAGRLRAGTGIATTSVLARLGFLAGPPLIGALATVVTLRAALLVVAAAALVIAVLAGRGLPSDNAAASGRYEVAR